jgi:hypothetical protein
MSGRFAFHGVPAGAGEFRRRDRREAWTGFTADVGGRRDAEGDASGRLAVAFADYFVADAP